MELVYFLHAERTNLVKIGWTANIVQRICKLRIACPHDVRLLAVRAGDTTLEGAYHHHFQSIREHGEWFSFRSEEMQWLALALRTAHADVWAEVVRLFDENAPELRAIKRDRYDLPFDILGMPEFDMVDSSDHLCATPRRRSRQVIAEGCDE